MCVGGRLRKDDELNKCVCRWNPLVIGSGSCFDWPRPKKEYQSPLVNKVSNLPDSRSSLALGLAVFRGRRMHDTPCETECIQ